MYLACPPQSPRPTSPWSIAWRLGLGAIFGFPVGLEWPVIASPLLWGKSGPFPDWWSMPVGAPFLLSSMMMGGLSDTMFAFF